MMSAARPHIVHVAETSALLVAICMEAARVAGLPSSHMIRAARETRRFRQQLDRLRDALAQLRPEHLGLSTSELRRLDSNGSAPILYYPIVELPWLTIAVFAMKSNTRLPLHDHPAMLGALKVIYGSVNITQYDTKEWEKSSSSSPSKLLSSVLTAGEFCF